MSLPELIANSTTPGTDVALTTLAASVTSTDTSISTAAAAPSSLQGSGQFRIVIDSEIMIVTAGASGTTWTVTRGAEGSTAAAHSSGASIYHYLTAGGLGAYAVQASTVGQASGVASLDGTGNVPLSQLGNMPIRAPGSLAHPIPFDGTTDAAPAINALATDYPAGAGIIEFPIGATVLCKSGITIPSKTVFRFNSRDDGIKFDASGTYAAGPSASGAVASPFYPLLTIGESGAYAFSAGVHGGTIDCQSIANSVGVYLPNAQEKAGLRDCVVTDYGARGVLFDGSNPYANGLVPANFVCEEVETIASATASTASSIGVDVYLNAATWHTFGAITAVSNGTTVGLAGVRFNGASGFAQSIHTEHAQSAILIGDSVQCLGLVIAGASGHSSVTDVVKIATPTQWTNENTALAALEANGATGELVNDTQDGVSVSGSSLSTWQQGLAGATAASRYVGATASGAPTTGTFAVGDFVVDQSGSFWVCTTAGTPGTWTQVVAGGGSGGYVSFTSSGTWNIPTAVQGTTVRMRTKQGGGGAGGGGSTSSATTVQAGGGGGGAGVIIDQEIQLNSSDTSLTITIGAGGTGGSGGAAGGSNGGYGSPGGHTSIVGVQSGVHYIDPGVSSNYNTQNRGLPSSANSASYGTGGRYGGASPGQTQFPNPGDGGSGVYGPSGAPMLDVIGGSGGGNSTSTGLGGNGGSAQQSGQVLAVMAAGTTGGSATANGTNGQNATMPGCGGGGGGGGAPGGAGGAGGNGADGQAEIWWQ